MATELIVNGGAELGDLSGWQVFPAATSRVSVITSPVSDGANAFRFRTDLGAGDGDVYIWQYIDTVPGTTYEGTTHFRGDDGDPGPTNGHSAQVELDLDNDGTFGTTAATVQWADTGSAWIAVPWTFTAQASRTGVRLSVSTSIGTPIIRTVDFYLDALSVPAVLDVPLLGLRDVTFGDLLDTVAFDAGDFSSAYRNQARTWLNLVRSKISSMGWWRSALNGEGEINVNGANTNGIYPLKDNANPVNKYAFVAGDLLFDVTNNRTLQYQDLRKIYDWDPDMDRQDQAWWWSDAGYNSDGEPLVLFFPRMTAATTVKGPMYRQLVGLDENTDDDSVDPFYGPVDDWAHAFMEGLRYYLEQDENEVGMSSQWRRFEDAVKERKKKQGIALAYSTRLRNLRPGISVPAVGLADPQHFDNPEVR